MNLKRRPAKDGEIMDDALFGELVESLEQLVEIAKGQGEPSRVWRYHGRILLSVIEDGKTSWTIEDAARRLRQKMVQEKGSLDSPDPKRIREGLRQTQEGFAELLGVSISTIRNWEQSRRVPHRSGVSLLQLAAYDPVSLLLARGEKLQQPIVSENACESFSTEVQEENDVLNKTRQVEND